MSSAGEISPLLSASMQSKMRFNRSWSAIPTERNALGRRRAAAACEARGAPSLPIYFFRK